MVSPPAGSIEKSPAARRGKLVCRSLNGQAKEAGRPSHLTEMENWADLSFYLGLETMKEEVKIGSPPVSRRPHCRTSRHTAKATGLQYDRQRCLHFMEFHELEESDGRRAV
uniref:Uncharacterized protein ORF110 n=1 Tax=Phaeoceros laevis TaxID=37308 RepID=D3J0J0_9EMBR|nr:hypothetical protein PhlaMp19 [Phaeoceros laevis]ACT75304.1 hypothetical protein PhlaMp19 [Phaeoceros laevis]